MVEIIEKLEPPFELKDVYQFKVYRSPKDGVTVIGILEPYGVMSTNSVTWTTMEYGVPVADAFLRTVRLAEANGIAAIWVKDTNDLFPATQRPKLA